MSGSFFTHPILNSPYAYPDRHWELDDDGQPTDHIFERRRPADFITPIPKSRKRRGGQTELGFDEGQGLSSEDQRYHMAIINGVRRQVDRWRQLPQDQWRVTPETARLLRHWRHHRFSNLRPFFCQVEAAETAIWLTEVAPRGDKEAKNLCEYLEDASAAANPGLARLALKMATGSGKTTVMAMLIAWQTVNKVRRPSSDRFTRGFLVVTPGITIRDRLRVLLPNDPESYYRSRELVPQDMLPDIEHARIVLTNYHAFKRRERMQISSGGRRLLEGRHGQSGPETVETTGQMLQRVMPELMGMKRILAINDEAHHCYREKPSEESDEGKLTGDDRKEAQQNTEAARLWISGLEAVAEEIGLRRVIDLSATPFFLSGSGYAEGTLFPWTMSDFSLMDAIECGIVKLPRVPVADNIPGADMPKFRELWKHIGKHMPKGSRSRSKGLDPLGLPTMLVSALDALYDHYAKTFALWGDAKIPVPPCFIIVCNNTATSKLVHDFISGFMREQKDGSSELVAGHLELFRNFDDYGQPLARPRTLLIDSQQLESGDALDANFRAMAEPQIDRYKRELITRTGDPHAADQITDQDLLREVMNTVGKEGKLGESVRCVVSVSMLTEGWDANTVTHVLGVRAFGTQLLCEQVVGRALRRQSYDLNEEGLFNVEYADIFGIPFDFTARPVVAPPQQPRETVHVRAIRPDRDALEISFPRVLGYRIEPPPERLEAEFDADSRLVLNPALVGPSVIHNAGIIGESVELTPKYLGEQRPSTIIYHLARHLLFTRWRDADGNPQLQLFGQLKRIARRWMDECLECEGGTYPAQLIYRELAEMACEKISAAILRPEVAKGRPVRVTLDPYNPTGSTADVNFTTSKTDRYQTDPRRCHVNWAILDSDWEGEFCRVAESHPRVLAYVKNRNLGLEVPYRHGGEVHTYLPDYIVQVDDGHGAEDPLNLIVEIKGYRGEDAKTKATTMRTFWVPGVNHLGDYGRWAFAEFTDVWAMEKDFAQIVKKGFNELIVSVLR